MSSVAVFCIRMLLCEQNKQRITFR